MAIVSERPQTTRRAVRGVATDTEAGWQLVLTDLPGVQRPRDALTERMQRRVEREIADSDAVLFVVNAEQGIGPGDRFISKALLAANRSTPVVCAVNKVDRLNNAETAAVLAATAELEGVDEIFPVSARKGSGLEPLVARLAELVPEGPFLYAPEQRSDLPSEVQLAELIREQVLRRTREELPHAVEVEVTEVAHREDGLVEVHAQIWAEADSQKGILIGSGGARSRRSAPPPEPSSSASSAARSSSTSRSGSGSAGAATRASSTGSGSSNAVQSRSTAARLGAG